MYSLPGAWWSIFFAKLFWIFRYYTLITRDANGKSYKMQNYFVVSLCVRSTRAMLPKGSRQKPQRGWRRGICPYIVSEIISSDLDESQKFTFWYMEKPCKIGIPVSLNLEPKLITALLFRNTPRAYYQKIIYLLSGGERKNVILTTNLLWCTSLHN